MTTVFFSLSPLFFHSALLSYFTAHRIRFWSLHTEEQSSSEIVNQQGCLALLSYISPSFSLYFSLSLSHFTLTLSLHCLLEGVLYQQGTEEIKRRQKHVSMLACAAKPQADRDSMFVTRGQASRGLRWTFSAKHQQHVELTAWAEKPSKRFQIHVTSRHPQNKRKRNSSLFLSVEPTICSKNLRVETIFTCINGEYTP